MHQHIRRGHLPCHRLIMLHNIHSQKLGERIAFDWNEMCCVTSEKKLIKPKTWKIYILYPSPSKEPNSLIRDNDDASKVSN